MFDAIEQRIQTAAANQHALPMGFQACQRRLLDRFDLAPQPRQRLLPDLTQDLGIQPFAVNTAGPESSFENVPARGQRMQSTLDLAAR